MSVEAMQIANDTSTVVWLLALPTGSMTLGGLSCFFYNPGPKQISGMQHFASGILLAAIGWELAPEVRVGNLHDKEAVIFGFILGASLLMFVGRYDFRNWKKCYVGLSEEETSLIPDREEHHSEEGRSSKVDQTKPNDSFEKSSSYNVGLNDKEPFKKREVPHGLIFAVLMDGSIDGLLIGISFIASNAGGLITAIAISLEMLLLGISTCATLQKTRLSVVQIVFLCMTLPLAIMGAGIVGSTLLSGFEGSWYTGIVSFGCAGLLYLVTEELMIEAHEDEDTDRWYVSVLFFMGFLLVIILDEFTEDL